MTITWRLHKLGRDCLSKGAAQKFDMENFNLKNLNDVEVKEQYQDKISNK